MRRSDKCSMKASSKLRMLICAPYGRDAKLISEALSALGMTAEHFADVGGLCACIEDTTAVIVVVEELLSTEAVQRLGHRLEQQPAWSDVPVIVLQRPSSRRHGWHSLQKDFPHANLILLERPLSPATMCSVTEGALRARLRQFELRDYLVEQKRQEQVLRESEERFRNMADAAPVLLWMTDADGRYVYFNKPWQDYTGCGPAEIGNDAAAAVHPEDRKEFIQTVEEGMQSGAPFSLEFRLRKVGGGHGWVYLQAAPRMRSANERAGFIGSCVDITDRRESEEGLRLAERQLRVVTDSIPAFISYIDKKHCYQFNNAMYEQRVGMTRREMQGRHISEVMGRESYEQSKPYIDQALAGRRVHFESRGTDKRGKPFVHDVTLMPHFNSGGIAEGAYVLATDITERKAAEEDAARLAAIVENSYDAIIGKDLEGVVTSWNHGAELMYGYSAAEMIGRSINELVPPSHLGEWQRIMRTLARGQRVRELESVRVRKDGRRISVSIASAPLFDRSGRIIGAATIARDITQRKEAERYLRISENRFRGTFENAAVGIAHLSTDGQWLRVNQTLCRILRRRRQELMHMHIGDVVQHNGLDQDLPALGPLFEGAEESLNIECPLEPPGGESIWVHMTFALERGDEGQPEYYILVVQDVTARRAAEEQLRLLNTNLEQRIAERTRALVQHQKRLRELASELTLTEQRERRRIAAEMHDYLAQLLVAAKMKKGQLNRLIDSENGQAQLTQLDELLDRSLQYTRTLIADLSPSVLYESGLQDGLYWLAEQMRQHELRVEVHRHGEAVKLPEDQSILIFQVVRELLFNVVKHAGVDVAGLEIDWQPDCLRIAVVDGGKGFNPEAAADPRTRKSYGLFTVRERLEALRSTFEVLSAPGKGARIELTVPIVAEKAKQARDERAAAEQAPPPHEKAEDGMLRILVADDHEIVRQGICGIISMCEDMHVIGEAGDGADAVRQASRLHPDVVVMDLNMPNMNGIDATRAIREMLPGTQIIGLSVHEDTGLSRAMLEAGARGYVTKGGRPEELCDAIRLAGGLPAMHGAQGKTQGGKK